MSKLKEQLLRISWILGRLEHGPCTTQDLQDRLALQYQNEGIDAKLSQDTITRAIKTLNEELGYTIDYKKQLNQWHLDRSRPLHATDQVLNRLVESFELFVFASPNRLIPPYIQLEQYQRLGLEHLQSIVRAIRESKSLSFTYHKYQSDVKEERNLLPLLLKEWHGRWYLIGEDIALHAIRSFSLDRIVSGSLSIKGKVKPSQAYPDIGQRYTHSYGIYASESYEVEHIVLEFDREDGRYLQSRPLHASQRIVEEGEDYVRLSLDLCVTPDFVMELMSRAWSLKVIAPQSLKERLKDIWNKAIERNRD